MVLENFSCIPRKRKRKYKNLKNLKNADIPHLCSIGIGDGLIIDEDWKVFKALHLKEAINKEPVILSENVLVVDKSVGSTELLESVDKSSLTPSRDPPSQVKPESPVEEDVGYKSSHCDTKCVVINEKNVPVEETKKDGLEEDLFSSEPLSPSFDNQTDALTREVLAAVDIQQVNLVTNHQSTGQKLVGQPETQDISNISPAEQDLVSDNTPVDVTSNKSLEPVLAVKQVSTAECAVQTDEIMIPPTPATLTLPPSSVAAESDLDIVEDTAPLLPTSPGKKVKFSGDGNDADAKCDDTVVENGLDSESGLKFQSTSPLKVKVGEAICQVLKFPVNV